MEREELVPDVLDCSPKHTLIVKFGNVDLNLGNTLTIEEVSSEPTEISYDASPNKFYTLCFTGTYSQKYFLKIPKLQRFKKKKIL